MFQDRLINDEDRDWFRNLLAEHMKSDFSMNFESVVQEPVLYGDFVAQTADKSYQELNDVKLVNRLERNLFRKCSYFTFSVDEETFR